ncbi:haloacid dehalogenase superfamily, subfamily IA, variant 3 with third motif having DD or ED [Tistlia consotensis]|uniref:Haloacid dehalogenase superfamily, subfamily IA, variant 3 with third motif having DD or ED n=1 Tax=Tistlia consotensis USBA 355 TaxID=560819 RepID=A0A1Y6CBZ0_9PROT|nr:HAD-IA family hydrolase [Tistlia consotensis]SMF55248.1 haloacid dehalogenase superfamily, subfamily IA, variant 3 with third motif having DD or ED [Tistlia consotensis USBA 355]SNR87981.1 haloacid dehalogenase superfamily, subfamily IA, variant 3 with third motif having DD or ED [Tistlia consotensis]
MRPRAPLEALIFDVDGTLAETEELHRRAFNAAFRAWGLPWSWSRERYRALLAVTGGKERLLHFLETDRPAAAERGRTLVAEIHAEKTARYHALLAAEGGALRPGVRRLLGEARAAGLRLAVATTTTPANVEALIRIAFGRPATALFEVVAAGDAVARKKPDPEVYRLALGRLGLPAGACLAFEDSANGLKAALGAGLATVVTPGLYTDGQDFVGASLVAPSLEAVGLGELEALVPAQAVVGLA